MGIEEVSPSEFEVLLSPNPAKGKVRVTLPGLSDVAVLQVYDMGGLLVRQFSVSDQTTDIEGLVPGMYIVKVSTPTFSRAQKLVVGR